MTRWYYTLTWDKDNVASFDKISLGYQTLRNYYEDNDMEIPPIYYQDSDILTYYYMPEDKEDDGTFVIDSDNCIYYIYAE